MVGKLDKIIAQIRKSNKNVPYADLRKVCDHYFERRPSSGGDPDTYKRPWAGDPKVNIQNRNGKAKPYQVTQVLKALDRLHQQESKNE